MKKFRLILSLFIFATTCVSAQNAIGDWQAHFSGRNAKDMAFTENDIYVACEQMIFRYDYSEIREIKTKIDGLSDSDIKLIEYIPDYDRFLVIYENSNIDILDGNRVLNFPAIKNKQISGDKTIYDIKIRDEQAWLATGFGIVLFDLERDEFSDTYYIGNEGNFVSVQQITFKDGYIYAATTEGLKRASLETDALYNYQNWQTETLPVAEAVRAVCSDENHIYAASESGELYWKIQGGWEIFNENYTNIQSIDISDNYLFFIEEERINIHTKDGSLYIQKDSYPDAPHKKNVSINTAAEGKDGNIYYADKNYSLIREMGNEKHQFIAPEGPFTNPVMQLKLINNKLTGTAGGFKINLNPAAREASLFKYSLNDKSYEHIVFSGHRDFYSIASPENDDNRLFIGMWDRGVFKIINGKPETIYNETNSSLQSILPNYRSVRIGAIVTDENKNMLMTNANVNEPVSVFTADGSWKSFAHSEQVKNKHWFRMLQAKDGSYWLGAAKTGGLYVFNTNGTLTDISDDKYNFFIPQTADGEESSSDIRSLEQDRDGTMWVGTGEGIFVYYYPEDVFNHPVYADRIQLTSVGADTSEQYLLKTEMVTAIKTDGANRKWIGTQNSGVFLVSPNGKEQIYAFNTNNSPLVSNTVNDIAIDPETGRVFFATSKGLLSFRAEATEGNESYDNVYVFPNPVRPGYQGKITVTGLVENSHVKITDVAGNLVYETKSLGGQAIWNGRDLRGRKVNTGVYLIFLSNGDGSQTHVEKLLFVN
jgi:ligand-binding sensor domain-containing protein